MSNSDLIRLHLLREAAKNKQPTKATNIEHLFSQHATLRPKGELMLPNTQFYTVSGEEADHYAQANPGKPIPQQIDMIGTPLERRIKRESLPQITLLSHSQLRAGLRFQEDAALLPLLTELVKKESATLHAYSSNEAIKARVSVRCGDVEIPHIDVRERYAQPTAYTVEMTFDTPQESLAQVREFNDLTRQMRDDEKVLLKPSFFENYTSSGAAIRRRLGPANRYPVSKGQIRVDVDSCITHMGGEVQYHFHTPRGNLILHTGEKPYRRLPEGFEMVGIENQGKSLQKLLDYGLIAPSRHIIETRVDQLNSFYEQLMKSAGDEEKAAVSSLKSIIEKLQAAGNVAAAPSLPRQKRGYFRSQQAEITAYCVTPTRNDLPLALAFPKIVSHRALQTYHDTERFQTEFEQATDDERIKQMEVVSAHVFFEHDQNKDVNLWLYQNHAESVSAAGLSFTRGEE